MRVYELMPIDNHKSFYGKAKVVEEDGTRTLYSYNAPVVREKPDGTLERLWGGLDRNNRSAHPVFLQHWQSRMG